MWNIRDEDSPSSWSKEEFHSRKNRHVFCITRTILAGLLFKGQMDVLSGSSGPSDQQRGVGIGRTMYIRVWFRLCITMAIGHVSFCDVEIEARRHDAVGRYGNAETKYVKYPRECRTCL